MIYCWRLTPKYIKEIFHREINKAYVAFYDEKTKTPIATGNWVTCGLFSHSQKGCGAFLGDVAHKSLVQLIAASEAERELIYYTFGNEKFSQSLQEVYNLLQKKAPTVGNAIPLC